MRRAILPMAAVVALAIVAVATGGGSAVAVTSPRCHTSDLGIHDLGTNAGAGSVFQQLRVRNVSGHTCHSRGYPGLQLISRLGNWLPSHAQREGIAHRIVLRSGRSATFTLSFHIVDLAHGGVSCHSHAARKLRVIPPGETTARLVTLRHGSTTRPCHGQLRERPLVR